MENFKLELTHQNGKKSELMPISFTYTIKDYSHMDDYDLCFLTYTLNSNYIKTDISNFYKIFGKSAYPKVYNIHSIVCNFNENDEIYNIFQLLCKHKKMKPCNLLLPHKQDFISEGKIQIETIDEVEKIPVISDFQLHCCIPVSVDYDNNTIEISVDFIEVFNTPKSKYQKLKNEYYYE